MKIILRLFLLISLISINQINSQNKQNQIVKAKMERDYTRILKTLTKAEQIKNNGGVIDIDRVVAKLQKLKVKDPSFNTSEADKIVASFNANTFDYDSWRKLSSIISRYSKDRGLNVFLDDRLLEDAKKINLKEIQSILNKKKNEGELDFQSKTIDKVINEFPEYLKSGGIFDLFMTQLDQTVARSGSSNPMVTTKKAKKLKQRAEALYAFVGPDNTDVKAIIKAIDKVIESSQSEMSNVITGAFHKENLGKVVLSSKPLQIGSENSLDIKTEFKTGEPIYGTVYFGRTLKDLFKTANFTKNGVTNFNLRFFKENGYPLLGQAEKWEIDSYAFHDDITVHRNNLGQSYIHFILLPQSPSELTQYAKVHNYTPVIFMRALASLPARKVKLKIKFDHVDYSGFNQEFETEFKIDLSQGKGPGFYEKEQNKLIDKYIEDNELPSAGMNNKSLEQQMMAHMNSKGWQETFVDAIIEQGDWTIEYQLGKPVRKIINAFMVAKHPDGYCFYHNYGFESRPTGSGWSSPQYRSSGSRTRILCSKVKH